MYAVMATNASAAEVMFLIAAILAVIVTVGLALERSIWMALLALAIAFTAFGFYLL